MRDPRLLTLVSALTRPLDRRTAARNLAIQAGADDLIIFLADSESGTLLPVPGFLQTPSNAPEWETFVTSCQSASPVRGQLPFPDSQSMSAATGIAGDNGSVLVLLGGTPKLDFASDIALLLPLLTAAFEGERAALIAQASAASAAQSVRQTKILAASLDASRTALREALLDAGNANRAKDRFLAALSHELRTPLTPVLIATTALENDPLLPASIRQDIAMVRRNVELEVNLIDDLLDLSRVFSGKLRLRPEPLDLNTLVAQAVTICEPRVQEKHICLTTELTSSLAPVTGDPIRIQQVLWNLLKNAVKFTPDGGQISIRTESASGQPVRAIVQDSGIGIETEALSRIFEAFEQEHADTPREFGGLGLGLAISKAIVTLHGGTLQAESGGRGRGATLILELPASAEPESTGCSFCVKPEQAPKCLPARILIAEDHADTAQLLTRLLRRAGHSVTAVATVAAALECLHKAPFDLLLSDLGLPDATGYELMRHAAKLPGITGIAMSGYGMAEDIRRSREAGFTEHLTKPVNLQRLNQAIQQILGEEHAAA